MNAPEAVTLLKDSLYLADERETQLTMDTPDYHALLALLAGMRWRRVADEKPEGGRNVLCWIRREDVPMFICSTVYLGDHLYWSTPTGNIKSYGHHFWLHLPAPPPE